MQARYRHDFKCYIARTTQAGARLKGYVQKTKSAEDSRAYLIQFTERGKDALLAAYEVKVIIENEYKELLGVESVDTLRALLETLIDAGE